MGPLRLFGWPIRACVLLVLVAPSGTGEEPKAPQYGPEVQKRLDALRAKGEPVTLDDLTPEPIPPEENAATIYRQAFEAYVEPNEEVEEVQSKDFEDWTPEELAAVRAWVEENQRAIALAKRAAAVEKCQFVDKDTGYDQKLPHLLGMRNMSWLLRSSASLLNQDGRVVLALEDCLAGVRLAEHVGQGRMLFAYAVQSHLLRSSLLPLRDVLPQAQLYEGGYEKIVATLECALENAGIRSALQAHRALNLDLLARPKEEMANWMSVVMLEESEAPKRPDWLDSERINILDTYGAILPLAERPFFEIAGDLERSEVGMFFLEESYPLTAMLLPAAASSIRTQAQLRTALLQVLVAVELEEHRRSTGAYPETLTELRLHYLPKMPVDPFSGRGFVYGRRNRGYILYSLGRNGKDDGGKPRTRGTDGPDDIVWSVTRKESN